MQLTCSLAVHNDLPTLLDSIKKKREAYLSWLHATTVAGKVAAQANVNHPAALKPKQAFTDADAHVTAVSATSAGRLIGVLTNNTGKLMAAHASATVNLWNSLPPCG